MFPTEMNASSHTVNDDRMIIFMLTIPLKFAHISIFFSYFEAGSTRHNSLSAHITIAAETRHPSAKL